MIVRVVNQVASVVNYTYDLELDDNYDLEDGVEQFLDREYVTNTETIQRYSEVISTEVVPSRSPRPS